MIIYITAIQFVFQKLFKIFLNFKKDKSYININYAEFYMNCIIGGESLQFPRGNYYY